MWNNLHFYLFKSKFFGIQKQVSILYTVLIKYDNIFMNCVAMLVWYVEPAAQEEAQSPHSFS